MSQRLITIAQYRDLPTAGLAQSTLESAGIICFLDNQFMIGINWLYSNALGGVKLQVLETDVEQALKLLKDQSSPAQSDEQEELDQLPPFVCPECGGSEITIINYTRKVYCFHCRCSFLQNAMFVECGHKWK